MITQERLKKLLHYNPDTGIFTSLCARGKIKSDDTLGWDSAAGYLGISIDYKFYMAHRLAWLYVYGDFPKKDIDHINHKKTDNRISNLRDVTKSQNLRNQKIRTDNTAGATGISWHKCAGKWRVYICVGGKQKHLGLFTDKDDAISARKAANKKYMYHINHGNGDIDCA